MQKPGSLDTIPNLPGEDDMKDVKIDEEEEVEEDLITDGKDETIDVDVDVEDLTNDVPLKKVSRADSNTQLAAALSANGGGDINTRMSPFSSISLSSSTHFPDVSERYKSLLDFVPTPSSTKQYGPRK